MLNYWTTLLALLLWMACLDLIGRRVAALLPFRERIRARAYSTPVLGCAVVILVATGTGWLAGYPPALTRTIMALLVLWGVLGERQWAHAGRSLLRSSAAAAVVSLPLFAGIAQFKGLHIFNDTFTYLVHGQWLQSHAFRVPVAPDFFAPAYTQVSLYQALGFRMGASFLLGWIQSVSGFTWSLQAYPVTIGLLVTVGALGIGGLAAGIVPGRRRLSFLWALVAGTTIGGFTYGTLNGFLPQTAGLALAAGLFSLLTRWNVSRGPGGIAHTKATAPLALTFAAAGFCYSELLPFLGGAIGLWFLARLAAAAPADRPRWWVAAFCFVGLAALLLNFELLRASRALLTQSSAVVGWPVPWSVPVFVAHSVGLYSGSGNGWIAPPTIALGLLLPGIAALVAAGIFVLWRRQKTLWATWGAPLGFLALCVAAFVLFRWRSPSPWPDGVGQTWNQFKLSNWVAPVLLGFVGAATLGLARGRARFVVGIAFALVVALHLSHHIRETPDRLQHTLRLTGRSFDPFAAYLELRQKAAQSNNGAIYLELGGAEHKSRQIAAYFLHDFPVLADWTGDGYIHPWLPPGWQLLTPVDAQWWVRRRSREVDGGSFDFIAMPRRLAARETVEGGYNIESDPSGWWVWSPDRVRVSFNVFAPAGTPARVQMVCMATSEPFALQISVSTPDAKIASWRADIGPGWQRFASEPFPLSSSKLFVEVEALGKAAPLGESDRRLAAMLVKNVVVEFLEN